MDFNYIEINNFQGIESLKISPTKKISVVIGENGKGKSSLLKAIRYGFTGEAPANFIKKGKNFASVAIKLKSGDFFERVKDNRGQKITLNGSSVSNKNLMESLEKLSGASKNAMKIISSKEVFEKLKPDELSSFLLQFIPERLDISRLESFIPSLSSSSKDELEKLFPAMPATFGIKEISDAFAVVDEQRKYFKREMDFATISLERIGEIESTRSLEQIEDDIKQMREIKERQAVLSKTLVLYNESKRKLEEQKKQLANLENELKRLSLVGKPLETKLQKLKNDEDEARKKISDIDSLLRYLELKLSEEKESLSVLKSTSCPLCESVLCPVDKSVLLDACEERIASLNEGIAIQKREREDVVRRIKEIQNLIDEYYRQEKLYEKKVKLLEMADYIKASLISLPSIPEIKEEELVDMKKRLEDLDKERRAAITYKQKMDIKKSFENYKEKYDIFYFLANELKPKGNVMNQVLAYYYEFFENACANISNNLVPGFLIRFAYENGLKLWIRPGNGKEYVLYESLSSGEKILASFVLLDMLNQLTGFNILLLDDIEHLDIVTFENFLKYIMDSKEIQNRYDHIFIAGAIHRDIADVLNVYKDNLDIIRM